MCCLLLLYCQKFFLFHFCTICAAAAAHSVLIISWCFTIYRTVDWSLTRCVLLWKWSWQTPIKYRYLSRLKYFLKMQFPLFGILLIKRETLGKICEEAKAGIFIVKFVKPFTVCEIMWETTSWHSCRWYVTTCNIASDQVNTSMEKALPAATASTSKIRSGNSQGTWQQCLAGSLCSVLLPQQSVGSARNDITSTGTQCALVSFQLT